MIELKRLEHAFHVSSNPSRFSVYLQLLSVYLPYRFLAFSLTRSRLFPFRKPSYPQTDPIFSAITPMVSSEFAPNLQWLKEGQESLECELPGFWMQSTTRAG
jgi:hypothetical protein